MLAFRNRTLRSGHDSADCNPLDTVLWRSFRSVDERIALADTQPRAGRPGGFVVAIIRISFSDYKTARLQFVFELGLGFDPDR